MKQKTGAEIEAEHQQKLKLEFETALGIRRRLHAIVAALHPKDAVLEASLQQTINQRCDAVVRELLHADSQETFALKLQNLRNVLTQLRQAANQKFDGETTLQLERRREFHRMWQLLQATRRSNLQRYRYRIRSATKDMRWEEAFNRLAQQKTDPDYELQKHQLFNELMPLLTNPVAQLLSEIDDEMLRLSSYRKAYLKNKINRWLKLGAASWVGLDGALLIISAVFGFAYPEMALPILIMSIASLSYGFIEFFKSAANLPRTKRILLVKNRKLSTKTEKELELELPGIDMNALMRQQSAEELQWLKEKKQFNAISSLLSIFGLLCTVVGFIFFFPPLSLPMEAFIAATIVNGIVVIGSLTILIIKTTHEQMSLDKVAATTRLALQTDSQLIAKIHATVGVAPEKKQLSTTATLIDAHIGGGASISKDVGEEGVSTGHSFFPPKPEDIEVSVEEKLNKENP